MKQSANICWTIQANVQSVALWHGATKCLISIPEDSSAVLNDGNEDWEMTTMRKGEKDKTENWRKGSQKYSQQEATAWDREI